jgi:hypothetical protein
MFAHKHIWVKITRIDFLGRSERKNQFKRKLVVRERLHTSTERLKPNNRGTESSNPRKRDGSKSTLELDITFSFLLLLSLLNTI